MVEKKILYIVEGVQHKEMPYILTNNYATIKVVA
jgi:hypothetical protein